MSKNKLFKFKLIILTALILFGIFSINVEASVSKTSITFESQMLKSEKVPVIIFLKDQPSLKNLSKKNALLSLKTHASDSQQSLVYLLKEEKIKGNADRINQFWIVNAIAVNASPELIERLAKRDDIEGIELDSEFHIKEDYSAQVSSDQIANATSEIKRINATKVWELGIVGSGINVSVIDTGINASHPDIAGRVVKWADLVGNRSLPYDDSGHGTHVAGTAGGNGSGGTTTGVAPDVNLFGVKVLDGTGSGYESDTIKGMQWSIDNKAKIISMSLSTDQIWTTPNCDADNPAMATAINNTVDAGIVVVSVAGNNPSGVSSPGCIQNVITAGAVDSSDAIASFSGRGKAMADHGVVAPGVSITSLNYQTGGYIRYSGTSMAAPHISGTVALLLAAAEKNGAILSPAQIKIILENASVDLGSTGKDNIYGAGRIDVFEAVKGQVLTAINGTVLDDVTNAGIAGAIVTTNTSVSTTANESGFYSLQVPAGTYTYVLNATSEPGYYPNASVIVTAISGTTVTQDIELVKKPIYNLNGKVINASSGLGINGALVKLVAYPQYNATTNGTGDYSISVPAGTYQVSASAPGYITNTTTVAVNANTLQNFRLTTSYLIYVPWTATTQGWTTPYVIANKGNNNANVSISYYNQADGSYAGSYSVSILPGASKFVFREWTTNTDGSAVLVSDQLITVIVDQFNNGQNKFGAYEVDQSGSSEVFLPWTATTQGWTTPYVIVNRGTANANVDITYYYVNGSVAGSYSVNILPGASKFVFREWSVGGDGAARISSSSSSQPISVLVDMFKNTENKFGAYTPASIANSQVFIPWTATTQGWITPFKIVNRGLSSAVVNISYYNQANGLLAGNNSVSIAPNEVVTVLRESSTANGSDGSAVINSTQPVSMIVQQFNNNEGKFEVYTPAMTASNTIVVPWTATTQGWTTPYVIVNKGSTNASVDISYYNQADGLNVGTYSVNILPGASKFVFREWTTNTDGSAVLVSDQPITVMVDQFNNGQNKFGAYTPIG